MNKFRSKIIEYYSDLVNKIDKYAESILIPDFDIFETLMVTAYRSKININDEREQFSIAIEKSRAENLDNLLSKNIQKDMEIEKQELFEKNYPFFFHEHGKLVICPKF
ncbi:unnamed protein product [Brachionus calyciflorus]|uniref:Uncharacterized protein n=1 Tax=Brachionus calyciflorus TaxID=104777 RepID=A0A814DQE0_9BILA|nr:unnamed protein product [Brachionus calyciflorus]